MSRRQQHSAPNVDAEAPHLSTNATGESQLASRIQEKENSLTHAIALTRRPQADPLRDGQVFARRDSPDGILDMKCNRDSLYRLSAGGRMVIDPRNGSGKDSPGRARNLGKAGRALR